jgi:hypothetical protein
MHIRFPLILIVFYVSAAVLGQPCGAAPLSRTARTEDPRLERRVSLDAESIHIGQLVERLSEKSQVEVAAGDPGDGAADERVSVYLRNVPLGDVMDGLYALMSYRSAEWHWRRTRTGGKGVLRYRLVQGRDAQLLGARLDQGVQDRFEAHAAAMLALLKMDPEDREAHLKRDPTAALLFADASIRRGVALFGDALTPEQQLGVLRNRGQVSLPTGDLSPASKSFVTDLFRPISTVIDILPDGTRRPRSLEPPTGVTIRLDGRGSTLAPMLVIELRIPFSAGEMRRASGYLGGRPLSEQIMGELAAEWMLPGDDRNHRLESLPMPAEQQPLKGQVGVEQRLKQLSEGVPVAVIARLSRPLRDPGSPSGVTLAEYLDKKLADEPWYLQHKWRGNILLISDPYWFKGRGADRPVPYETVKWLRETQAANDGFLLLPHLAAVAGRLSQNQLLNLKGEFPVLANVAHWRPLFALYNSSPVAAARLTSRRGVPLAEVLPAPLAAQGQGQSTPSVLSALAGGQFEPYLHPARGNAAAAIRMREQADNKVSPPVRRITVELLSRDGDVLTGGGFFYKQHSPKPPAAADPAKSN